ncbi:MAG: tetratricopeptide repeat protein [Anaerolineaceae bacterium]
MSRIPLRKYIQEIEVLIENGNLDEAQKHCLYILKTFPKNIAVYRLLGKVLMEKGSYEDSVFVFEKVLEVIPDDFVSHVGLSFISEVHEHLDDAVLHMEHAFELQPTNTVLKEELKRLHLKKDGIEPQTIRLTRGALINMYLRSSLYPQAIAELRIGLQTNPSRIDFKEHLAEALVNQGEKIEAVQTCIEILGKAPFNFTANRIAYDTIPNASNAMDTQAFHQHLIDVDPYFMYVGDRINHVEDVPDVAVSFDRYDGKKPIINTDAINIQQEIESHWNKKSDWKENEDQESEFDWDSIIDNRLSEKKEKTKKISLELPSEFIPESESKSKKIDHQPEISSDLETSDEMNEQVSDEIPGWIFDEPDTQKEEAPFDFLPPESFEDIPLDQLLDQTESGMVDQDVPTISEPESENISKHWVKIENDQTSRPQSSLEDTQKLKVQAPESNEEIFRSALNAIDKNDLHFAIQKFDALLEDTSHVEDIIQTIENSASILMDEPDAWYVLGKAYLKTNQKDKALNAFRKAEETSFS